MTPHARHIREMRASVAELRAPAAGLPMGIAALSMLVTIGTDDYRRRAA